MAKENLSGTINKKARPSPRFLVSVKQPPAFFHDVRHFSKSNSTVSAKTNERKKKSIYKP